MKKYFIVLILGLFLGVCFARSAYGQENYFTPGLTMKALQESEESKESYKYAADFYCDVYFEEHEDIFEIKYNIEFKNVKYPDIKFTLTYKQYYLPYNTVIATGVFIDSMLLSIEQNIFTVLSTIDYCNSMGYEEDCIKVLEYFVSVLQHYYSYIKDRYSQYLEAPLNQDFVYRMKYVLEIQDAYWELFVKIGSHKNPDGTNIVTITYTEK